MSKVATEEFNRFWDEVLGEDWYTEEGEIVDGEPLVDLSDMVLAWQGHGEPEPNGILKARDLDGRRTTLYASTLFRRWKKAQTTTVVLASFDVTNEGKDALLAQIKAMGGKVVR